MRQRSLLLALLVGAMLAACNSVSGELAGPDEGPSATDQRPAENMTPQRQDIATLAIDALAADLGVPQDTIAVDTVRAVDWPDSSIGCPKPGRAYLQVITPGHKVTLRADGRIYVVHEANNRALVCHQTKAYAGVNPQRELVFGPQMIAARKDLAAQLGVPESDIKPMSAEERTWNDASLGCPEPGRSYPPVNVTGWVMTLRHDSRDYTYHTDMQRTIACPPIAAE
ncbi:MAG: hypothetical protein ACRETI_07165 [Steroidobacteraceae bacterium]